MFSPWPRIQTSPNSYLSPKGKAKRSSPYGGSVWYELAKGENKFFVHLVPLIAPFDGTVAKSKAVKNGVVFVGSGKNKGKSVLVVGGGKRTLRLSSDKARAGHPVGFFDLVPRNNRVIGGYFRVKGFGFLELLSLQKSIQYVVWEPDSGKNIETVPGKALLIAKDRGVRLSRKARSEWEEANAATLKELDAIAQEKLWENSAEYAELQQKLKGDMAKAKNATPTSRQAAPKARPKQAHKGNKPMPIISTPAALRDDASLVDNLIVAVGQGIHRLDPKTGALYGDWVDFIAKWRKYLKRINNSLWAAGWGSAYDTLVRFKRVAGTFAVRLRKDGGPDLVPRFKAMELTPIKDAIAEVNEGLGWKPIILGGIVIGGIWLITRK